MKIIKLKEDQSLDKLTLALKINFTSQEGEEVKKSKIGLIVPTGFNAMNLYNLASELLNNQQSPDRMLPKIAFLVERGLEISDKMLINLHILATLFSKSGVRVFGNLSDAEFHRLSQQLEIAERLRDIKKNIFSGEQDLFINAVQAFVPMFNSAAISVLEKSNILSSANTQPSKEREEIKEVTTEETEEVLYQGKNVLLIDCHNFFHRTYHAFGNVVNNEFQPIGLVRGLSNLIKYINSEKPDFVVFANEGTENKDVRKEIFPKYKAGRSEVEEALKIQIPMCLDVIKKLGFPIVSKEGYEADDIIASYTRAFKDAGANVKIYSSDKDLYQLIDKDNGQVQVYDWTKKKIISNKDCLEKFGVEFDKCLLVQAIMGDTSDGVPGAKGVGMKKASDLINRFSTIEGIYDNLDELKGALKRNIEEQEAEVMLSLRLVSLNTDLAEINKLPLLKTPFYKNKDLILDTNTEEILQSA